MSYTILQGNALDCLREMPDESVHCVVTSPPYWGLRDYGTASWEGGEAAGCTHTNLHGTQGESGIRKDRTFTGAQNFYRDKCRNCGAVRVDHQIGLENTPQEYVAKMVAVFRELRRVLRRDGTAWVNLGDSYAGSWGAQGHFVDGKLVSRGGVGWDRAKAAAVRKQAKTGTIPQNSGLKPKDLVGIPWRLAFALQQPYTDWRIKTEAMRAWVGGIVDGEGCITILRTKSSHSKSLSFPPVVQVRMCDVEPLQRLVDVAGSSFGKPQMPPSHAANRQRDQWKLVSDAAARVIAEIYPYLTCKRKQAIVAWNHQQFRAARGNQERKRGDIEKEQFCKELINKLNQRQPADIPSWMREPIVAQEAGWYLRQDLIWHKPNPMPESISDRCTKAHEYIFLLSKSATYFYDADAIAEPVSGTAHSRGSGVHPKAIRGVSGWSSGPGSHSAIDHNRSGHHPKTKQNESFSAAVVALVDQRNKRSVWTVASQPFPEAHFATFPEELIKPCILAGCPIGGIVLDPFNGSGTTGVVALRYHRNYIGIELSKDYVAMSRRRIRGDAPLLNQESEETS